MTTQIIVGDCRKLLLEAEDNSIHCCVTSPPYFGLRDYGVTGQIGLEQTPDEYIAEMVALFQEVRRVLRADGTLWLNLGDSYANGGRKTRDSDKMNAGRGMSSRPGDGTAKPKDRLMIPARVALALQADGWWLRDEIIWHKPNPMPVSVKDRTTPAHEMLYMFSKSANYYYDMEAIKEPALQPRGTPKTSSQHKQNALGNNKNGTLGSNQGAETRQPRSVWTITPKPFKGAHFATFPPALVEPCIKAGSPAGGIVLDPFGGTGTTGLVAQQLGRDSILLEINPEYALMARERIGIGANMIAANDNNVSQESVAA